MQKTTQLDSPTFATMLRQGAVQLGRDKKVVNDLNVFPIPDGDTGDNMLMTLKAGCTALEGHLGTLSEVASAASSGMLLGARGNSGVILSRIFAGLAKGLKGMVEADAKTFAKAMQAAVDEAYKSVPVPVEGTIITVLREGAAGADACGDLTHYFETLLEAMQTSLDHTPELLPVLKDAGVVDSGGAGLLSIFRGMNDALKGNISQEEIEPTTAVPVPMVELNKFDENSKLEFGYCTEFLLRLMRSKVDLDSFDENVIIDYLNKEISFYISHIMVFDLEEEDAVTMSALFKITGNIERMGDHATNIAGYANLLEDKGLRLSDKAQAEVKEMMKITEEAYATLIGTKPNSVHIRMAQIEQKIDDMTDDYREHQLERLKSGVCSGEACVVYSEMLTDFERLGDHMLNVAEAAAESNVKSFGIEAVKVKAEPAESTATA